MKPTIGKVQPRPAADPKAAKGRRSERAAKPKVDASAEDSRLADMMMISLYTGVALLLATVLLVALAAPAGYLGADLGGITGAKVGFGIGLAVGLGLILLALRRFGPRLRARNQQLVRGAWLGTIIAAIVLVFLYFLPNVALPTYCPPGAICSNGQP